MTAIKAVTTFGAAGWEAYAKDCLRTVVAHWPGEIVAYYEDEIPQNNFGSRVEWKPLYEVEKLIDVLTWAKQNPVLQGLLPYGYSYNFDLYKFCRKVFAQFDTALNFQGILYWLDADCEILRPVPENLLIEQLKDTYTGYYGRRRFHIESGIIGWDTRHITNRAFMHAYRDLYISGNILQLKGWHDCWAYMSALRQVNPPNRDWNSEGTKTPIGAHWEKDYIIHHKGARKYSREPQNATT